MNPDVVSLIAQALLSSCVAILFVLFSREAVRKRFGNRVAYSLWGIVPAATISSMIPAELIYIDRGILLGVGGPSSANVLTGMQTEAAVQALESPMLFGLLPEGDANWLALIWAVGAVLSLLVLAVRQWRALRVGGRKILSSPVIFATDDDIGPAVVGFFKPRIIIPKNFANLFDRRERMLILAHERAHIRAGDLYANLLAASLKAMNWFNPVGYFAYTVFRADQEMACDERVMQQYGRYRKIYAKTLLKSQLISQHAPLDCAWVPSALPPLKQRVRTLSGPMMPARPRIFSVGVLVAAITFGSVSAWAMFSNHVMYIEQGDLAKSWEAKPPSSNSDQMGAALIRAVQEHRKADVRRLVRDGADVNHSEIGEGSPLILAAHQGDMDLVRFLVGQGADVNGFVLLDETPLIKAAQRNHLDVAQYLIKHGADVNLAVETGNGQYRSKYRSPLGQADLYGYAKMSRLLRGAGAKSRQAVED